MAASEVRHGVERASRRTVDRSLLGNHPLPGDLAEVASCAEEQRSPHTDTADARSALTILSELELRPLGP